MPGFHMWTWNPRCSCTMIGSPFLVPKPITGLSATLCLLSALAPYRIREHSTASVRWHAGKRRSSTGCWQIINTELQGRTSNLTIWYVRSFPDLDKVWRIKESLGNRPVTILEVQGGGGCQRKGEDVLEILSKIGHGKIREFSPQTGQGGIKDMANFW